MVTPNSITMSTTTLATGLALSTLRISEIVPVDKLGSQPRTHS